MIKRILLIVCLTLVALGCTTYKYEREIEGKPHTVEGTKLLGVTLHEKAEPVKSSHEKTQDRLAGYGVMLAVFGCVSACIGFAASLLILNPLVQRIGNAIFICGSAIGGAGILLTLVASIYWILVVGLIVTIGLFITGKAKDKGISWPKKAKTD